MDTDSDLELDEVESAKLKQKVKEASEYLALELRQKKHMTLLQMQGLTQHSWTLNRSFI